MAGPILPGHAAEAPRSEVPVHLYVDRSGSMAGYLDRQFGAGFGVEPGSSSLRRILSQLSSARGPLQVYGFGNGLIRIEGRRNQDVIAQLVRQEFYSDNNTQLEDVLDAVAADSGRGAAHLIVTDGRRGDGASAIAQYQRMGQLARTWVGGADAAAVPGVFAVSAVQAPFQQIRADSAGCWSGGGGATFRCPLYVFAFLPASVAPEMLPRLREVSEYLHVVPTLADTAVSVQSERQQARAGASEVHAYGGGATGRPLMLMMHSEDPERAVATTEVRFDLGRSPARFSIQDGLEVRLARAPLCGGDAVRWVPVENPGSGWVVPGEPAADGRAGLVRLPLELRARDQVPPAAYRVELVSVGRPAWLDAVNAPQQGDSTRTYGLSTLFGQLGKETTPLAGFYVAIY